MAVKTVPFDAALYLSDARAQAELLDDALQSGDASYIGEALAVIARARDLTTLAGAEAIPDGDSQARPDRDPRLSTLLEVARELGVRLHVQTAPAE